MAQNGEGIGASAPGRYSGGTAQAWHLTFLPARVFFRAGRSFVRVFFGNRITQDGGKGKRKIRGTSPREMGRSPPAGLSGLPWMAYDSLYGIFCRFASEKGRYSPVGGGVCPCAANNKEVDRTMKKKILILMFALATMAALLALTDRFPPPPGRVDMGVCGGHVSWDGL